MNTGKIKIAILGASSHIAKGLIFAYKDDQSIEMYFYARNFQKVDQFLNSLYYSGFNAKPINEFGEDRVDVIINCIGITDLTERNLHKENIFEVTEHFDKTCIDYIRESRKTIYINLSSGAVYGTQFNEPASKNSIANFEVNNIQSTDFYRIVKLNSEIKHRSVNFGNIIDLRIFGYFSRFIDLSKNYLLTEIIRCVKENKTFITSPVNIIRDYIHPEDLAELIKSFFEYDEINAAFDVMSLMPVSKMEILDFYKQIYGLQYKILESSTGTSATGEKLQYYSENKIDMPFKFTPKYTSIESIRNESVFLFRSL